MITIAIRLTLTAVIVYYVYLETGPVTAFAFSLVTLNNEMTAVLLKNLREAQESICSGLERIARPGD
jgi:hypothetical protein